MRTPGGQEEPRTQLSGAPASENPQKSVRRQTKQEGGNQKRGIWDVFQRGRVVSGRATMCSRSGQVLHKPFTPWTTTDEDTDGKAFCGAFS